MADITPAGESYPVPAGAGWTATLPCPVLTVSRNDKVTFANAAARRWLDAAATPPAPALDEDLRNCLNRARAQAACLEAHYSRHGRFFNLLLTSEPADGSVTLLAVEVTAEHQLRERQRHAQRAEALGALTAGVAHDFSNILTSVIGYAQLARLELPPAGRAADHLEHVLRASQRATELVRQILAFAHLLPHETRTMALQFLVKECAKLLAATLPATVRVHSEVSTRCRAVRADAASLYGLIVQLAIELSHGQRERGGDLLISLAEIELRQPCAASPRDLAPGAYARITLCGTPRSAPSSQLGLPPYPGQPPTAMLATDALLASVAASAAALGGAVTVESRTGRDTTCAIHLPIHAADSPDPADEATDPALLPTGTERVLFVDDEPMLGEFVRVALERLGYTVTAYAAGPAALERFRRNPAAFDLLITDQIMPDMTGLELAGEMLRLRPDLPILIVTGYLNMGHQAQALPPGIRGVLAKPLTMRDLSFAVRTILEGGRLRGTQGSLQLE